MTRVCLKCGASLYKDAVPYCEHEYVPEPSCVWPWWERGEQGFCAGGLHPAHASVLEDGGVLVAFHPTREGAIEEWKRQWTIAWAADLIERLAAWCAEYRPTEVDNGAEIDDEEGTALENLKAGEARDRAEVGGLATALRAEGRIPIGTVTEVHGPDPQQPDHQIVTIQFFRPSAVFTEAERGRLIADGLERAGAEYHQIEVDRGAEIGAHDPIMRRSEKG